MCFHQTPKPVMQVRNYDKNMHTKAFISHRNSMMQELNQTKKCVLFLFFTLTKDKSTNKIL